MFDHIGDFCIGLVFGIVLMFMFDSMLGLVAGFFIGVFFLVNQLRAKRRIKKYMPYPH